jgi:2-oxoglutarate ferredoxin oxidoreductase subunit delta
MPVRLWRKPLDTEKVKLPKAEIHIIKDQCKGCGFCIQFCPKKVLEESEEINARGVHPPKIIDEDKCIICGFCTSVCPDFAIFVLEKPRKEECKV